jgi:hypothetical protein
MPASGGSFFSVAFASEGAGPAAGPPAEAFEALAEEVIRRTDPSSLTTSVSSRMSLSRPETGLAGSVGRLSSVMMRLIDAIISSIEGSGGDLALSGMDVVR